MDDMLKIRGQNVWPDAVGSVIFENANSEEYQARVWIDERGRERVEVRVEFRERAMSESEARVTLDAMQDEIKAVTDLSMDLVLAAHGTLPRFEQTKARRWTDDRKSSTVEATEKLQRSPS